MKHFFTLLKIDLQNTYNGGNRKVRKSFFSRLLKSFLGKIILGVIGLAMIGAYEYFLFLQMNDFGVPEFLLSSTCYMALLLMVATMFQSGTSFLFNFKDHDLLFSLPLSPFTILAAKLSKLYITTLSMSALLLTPAVVIYGFFTRMGITHYLLALLAILVLPILVIAVSLPILMLIMLIASGTKYVNLIQNILSIALFMVFGMSTSFISQMDTLSQAGEFSSTIYDALKTTLLPARYFSEIVSDLNVASFLKLMLLSIIPFLIVVFLFQKIFFYINARLQEKPASRKFRKKRLKRSSIFGALFRKEMTTYFKTPFYFFQGGFGSILWSIIVLVGLVLLIVNQSAYQNIIAEIIGDIGQDTFHSLEPFIILGAFACVAYFTNLQPMSASSISVEHKALWVTGSLPIDLRQAVLAKILIHPIVICLFPTLITALLMGLSGLLSPLGTFFFLIISLSYSMFFSLLGFFIDSRFPKLDWTTPAELFKRNNTSLIIILADILLLALIVGSYFVLTFFFPQFMGDSGLSGGTLTYFISLSCFLVLFVLLCFQSTLKRGSEHLQKIITEK